ncbi:MAG TPA: NnrU family protein [Hyphomicrobiales bacterium]|nr:NnrU family protein [Hyphomicrobiales bacterium]
MSILVLGLIILLGIHSLPMAPALRDRLRQPLGETGYKAVVGIVSLVGLVLIVWGYGLARAVPVVVWDPPVWTRHVAALLMVFSFILVVAAYIPGRIREKLRHPMLAGVKLWAFAHLIANGTLADIVLFGVILIWAIVDRISLKRREVAGLVTVTGGPPRNDAIAVVVGLVVYVLFAFWLHEWLIGVAPFA